MKDEHFDRKKFFTVLVLILVKQRCQNMVVCVIIIHQVTAVSGGVRVCVTTSVNGQNFSPLLVYL